MTQDQSALVRALNDRLREAQTGGAIMVTSGVAVRGPMFVARALKFMAEARQFDEDNDPHGEHDFGALDLDGVKLFWKIDYYDQTLTHGADNPADAATCRRVLTLMRADEY